MIRQIQKTRQYLDYLEEHYNNVQKAWKLIQEKCEGKGFRFMEDTYVFITINTDVANHDTSKLSKEEFTAYRKYFFPVDKNEKNKEEFDLAWEHHKANNDHHWQNWTVSKQSDPYSDIYLVHNLVDWVAMSFKFGDTAKEFYEKNQDKINLPDWAVKLMYEIFDCIYSPELEEA